eukprot:Em0003g1181a
MCSTRLVHGKYFLKGMGKRKFRLGQHQKNEEHVGRCLIVSVPRESVSVSVTPFLNISVPPTLYSRSTSTATAGFPICIPLLNLFPAAWTIASKDPSLVLCKFQFQGNKVAVLDDSLFPEHPTIRHKQCEMLLPGDAASVFATYRTSLLTMQPVRQRGGVHENSNAVEFAKNTQALRVMKSVGKSSSFGNCRCGPIKQASMDELCEPLPKRRRTSGKRSDLATSSYPTFSALQQSEFETPTLLLRISSEYATVWKQFLDGIAGENPAHFPKVYHYVGHFMFKEKVKSHYAIDTATSGNADDYGLTCYALRYSAGYVLRTLRRSARRKDRTTKLYW